MSIKHLSDDEIQAYLDHDTDIGGDHMAIHLAGCADCRHRLEQYQILYAALTDQDDLALSPQFENRVMAALSEPVSIKVRFFEYFPAIVGILASLFLLIVSVGQVGFQKIYFVSQAEGERLVKSLNGELGILIAAGLAVTLLMGIDRTVAHWRHRPL